MKTRRLNSTAARVAFALAGIASAWLAIGGVMLTATPALAAGVAPWSAGTSYQVGALVTFGEINFQKVTYRCRQAHTAIDGWEPPTVHSLWERPTPPNFEQWATQTNVTVNHKAMFNGSSYQCLQAHNSEDTWTPPATPALWKCSDTSTISCPRSTTCNTNPWSLPDSQCKPKLVVESTKITNVAPACNANSTFPVTTIAWTMPKIVNDHSGGFDNIGVSVTTIASAPEFGRIELFRNGVAKAFVEISSEGDQESNVPQTLEVRTILAFFQRAEVLAPFLATYEGCSLGPSPIVTTASGGPGGGACRSCKQKGVLFGILYGLAGVACCVGTAGAGCALCASVVVVSGGVGTGAIASKCSVLCAEEVCKQNYDDCVAKAGTGNGLFTTFGEKNPPPPTNSDCEADYNRCMDRAETAGF
jgi:hypothetical protein